MKVLLVLLDKESHINQFPLGVAYIAAYIRENGHEVEIYNQEVYHYPDEHITEYLDNNDFDVVAIGIFGYQMYRKAISFCKCVRKSKKFHFLVLGSHGPTAEPEHFIRKMDADYIVMGEGEVPFNNLLNGIETGTACDVKGIAYLDSNDEIVINEREEIISDIDSLPFPARDLFPMDHYALDKHLAANHTDRCTFVITSRGCPYNCNFCYRIYKGYRLRSVESVIEEVKQINKDYNINHITFIDENLMSTKKIALRFAEAMIKANLGLKWNCMGRLKVATPDVLKVMKQAGCEYINYGVESVDQNVLDLMNKKQTIEEIYNGIDNTIESGIIPGLNILWGSIGDDDKTLRKNVEFLIKYNNNLQVRTIKPITPYPGTKFYDIAIEKGLLKNVDDFYNKYTNSDRMTVNFTDLTEKDFYHLLYHANKDVLSDFYNKVKKKHIKGFKQCYFNNDPNFRGVRHG